MDKRNQMENPFFDPDKPGSIFVGMDRYHQYSPHQPRNALTFIQKGDADSLFRKFLIDNIKEAECCPYIPDTELLRFDLANMRQVPPVDTHTPFEEYISKELLPYFQEHCIPPAKRISLRDAVYTYKYKNEPDGGILKKYLMQEPAYLEFRLQQQEKRTLYRCQPRYTFPLKVVENDCKYSINSLVYWVTYVHNVVYSFYRSMIYCYINSTQRCAGSIVIDIIPTNGADKRKFFPFAPYFPVTNVIKRYFYPYFPAIIGIKGYSFPYFPYLSGIMKIKTALYSLFSRLDWHKTVVFPCLGEIYEGIRSLSWEIPVT